MEGDQLLKQELLAPYWQALESSLTRIMRLPQSLFGFPYAPNGREILIDQRKRAPAGGALWKNKM
jgi:hypothetical protein